jgi:hypothetical protein
MRTSNRSAFAFPTFLRFTRRLGRGFVFEEEVLILGDAEIRIAGRLRQASGS